MVQWVRSHGSAKTPEAVKEFTDGMMAVNPYENPEKRDWFVEQVKPLGLDPAKTTLFDWLEVDDRESYKKAA